MARQVSRSPRKVLFAPDWRRGNPYQARLAGAIETHGYSVSFADFPRTRFPLTALARAHADCGLIHIHWIQPLIAALFWSPHPLRRAWRLALLVIDLRLCRLRGVKIFWTIHNLTSHDSPDHAWERRIRGTLSRHVNGCFVHSDSAVSLLEAEYATTLRATTTVVAHASYSDDYPTTSPAAIARLRAELNLDEGHFVYLFMGAIRGYKGVSELLSAFQGTTDPTTRLLIAGHVDNAASRRQLVAAGNADQRIVIREGFVPEVEVTTYLGLADVMVLPFARTLTSGSALLALSFGKPLILPQAARVFDTPGERGALYYAPGGLRAALSDIRARDLAAMAAFNRHQAQIRTWAQMGQLTTVAYRTPGGNARR